MTPILAHQGGWDELLLPALVVLGLIWVSKVRRRHEVPDASTRATAGTCGYCGAALTDEVRRCPSCGFRVTSG